MLNTVMKAYQSLSKYILYLLGKISSGSRVICRLFRGAKEEYICKYFTSKSR